MVETPQRTRDPVCGKILVWSAAKHKAVYEGKEYRFCSSKHRKLFEQNPTYYLRLGVPLA